ncbi:MAG: divalent-cation tolerance protein CutA [Planctomycetaceae bacterium]|nr:divalent-cation tolerance protein CutA [Planctomycetaceae bacterium]
METITHHALLYVTTESREEALAIGRELVEERVVACANVLDGMTSVYHWKDTVEQADEAVLLLKTRQELVPRVMDRLQELHSYDCPCILELPIRSGNPGFLQWVTDETISPTPPPVA